MNTHGLYCVANKGGTDSIKKKLRHMPLLPPKLSISFKIVDGNIARFSLIIIREKKGHHGESNKPSQPSWLNQHNTIPPMSLSGTIKRLRLAVKAGVPH